MQAIQDTQDTQAVDDVTAAGSATSAINAVPEAVDAKKQSIITAPQPAAPSTFVDMVKNIFHFKTATLVNEQGKEVGKGKKHPSVEIFLPVPKKEKIAEYLLDAAKFPKEADLVMSAISEIVARVARMQVNEFREAPSNKDALITPAVINYDKLDWTAIANMPKAERGAYVPSEEDQKSFLESYLEIMPKAADKPRKNIENHIVCFQSGFKKQRAQKEILEMFQSALLIYLSSAGEELVEEHLDVIDYFQNRLARMLKSEEKISLDDL